MRCEFITIGAKTVCSVCGKPTKLSLDNGPIRRVCQSGGTPNSKQQAATTGTYLHEAIKRWTGESYTTGCGCQSMVAKMNRWGPDGCREHLDEIVNKMTKEAKKRGWKNSLLASIPIASKAGMRAMVLLAIRKAEKEITTQS